MDSGLSTAGALNFAADSALLEADPATVVDGLRATGSLPDLRGFDIVFPGLGDVADPQPRLSMAQRTNLIAIWRAIVAAAQASSVTVDETPLRGEPRPGLPKVSVVPLWTGEVCIVGRETFHEGEIGFAADSADFRDAVAARATIAPIAETMLASNYSAGLTGTTANVGDMEGQVRLSQLRAEAVRDVFIEFGVPAEQLTAEGVGSAFDGYTPDRDEDGNLDPELAAANRTVIVELLGAVDVHCG